MFARVYFMKAVNVCKDVSIMSPQDEQWRRTTYKFILFVYCNSRSSLNINKQIVNVADENLTDYSFRRMYHYAKSKNYLKGRYRIRHWIQMFIGTPWITENKIFFHFFLLTDFPFHKCWKFFFFSKIYVIVMGIIKCEKVFAGILNFF